MVFVVCVFYIFPFKMLSFRLLNCFSRSSNKSRIEVVALEATQALSSGLIDWSAI